MKGARRFQKTRAACKKSYDGRHGARERSRGERSRWQKKVGIQPIIGLLFLNIAFIAQPPSWRPSLKQLIVKLEEVKWETVVTMTIKLGVKKHKIDQIESDHPTVERRKTEAFHLWLKEPDINWKDIVNGLNEVGEKTLAHELEMEYVWKEPRVCSLAYFQVYSNR